MKHHLLSDAKQEAEATTRVGEYKKGSLLRTPVRTACCRACEGVCYGSVHGPGLQAEPERLDGF